MGGTIAVIGVLALMVLIFFVRAYAAREAKIFRLRRLLELGQVAEFAVQSGNRQKAEQYAEAVYQFRRETLTWAVTAIPDQADQRDFLYAFDCEYGHVKMRLDTLGLDQETIARNRAAEAEPERVRKEEAPSGQPHPPHVGEEAPRAGEALAAFKKAIVVNPNDADAYFTMAGAYERLQKGHDAIAAYEECLRLEPAGPHAEAARKAIERLRVYW